MSADYKTFDDIYNALMNREVSGALLDAFAIGSRKDLFEQTTLKILRIYDYHFAYGVVMGADSRKLKHCSVGYLQLNKARIMKRIALLTKKIEVGRLRTVRLDLIFLPLLYIKTSINLDIKRTVIIC